MCKLVLPRFLRPVERLHAASLKSASLVLIPVTVGAPATADGSVRAENGAIATAGVAFVPEVMFNGNWYPICGHYFWDDN